MQNSESLEFQQEEVMEFRVQNEIYLIKVTYTLTNRQVDFDVQEKRLFEFYHVSLTNETLPEDLAFYENVETLYYYLSKEPEKNLEYNAMGKYILFFDLIGKKIKYHKIFLERRMLTEQEKQEIKFSKVLKEKQDLEGEVNKLKIELEIVKEKDLRLTNEVNQLEKEKSQLLFRIKKQEEQAKLLRLQNKKLKDQLGLSDKPEEQDERFLQNMRKMRKGQDGDVVTTKIMKEQDDKGEDVFDSKNNFLSVVSRRGIISQKQSQFSYNSNDLVYYGTKMKYYIQEQPNRQEFSIDKSTIVKTGDSDKKCLLYFSWEDRMYLNQRRQTRVFLEFKNTTSFNLCSHSAFNFVVGVMPASAIHLPNMTMNKAAIFLSTTKGIINLEGVQIQTKVPLIFNQGDVMRLVLDVELYLMAWFLNDTLIREVVFDSTFADGGLYPFIELFLQGTSIQIL